MCAGSSRASVRGCGCGCGCVCVSCMCVCVCVCVCVGVCVCVYVHRLRKQAKTRAVKEIREAMRDASTDISQPVLRGYVGALAPAAHIEGLLLRRTVKVDLGTTQFTRFTSTKVQILTKKRQRATRNAHTSSLTPKTGRLLRRGALAWE